MSELFSDAAPEREIFSPSQLVRLARDLLEDTFPLIWVEGEISNFSRPASGHLYFSLKDAQAQIRCAMFKNRAMLLRFRPADGTRVLARVRVSLYEARGEFQLIVEHLEEAGEGALLRAFEQLKAKLAAEGLFDAAKKRALPKLPRRIGVITSATGAAVRDVLSVLSRRFPLVDVEVIPVPVQGKEAPPAIITALNAASAARRHDVLLLTRGGGSLEDLWAFNDERVARAIRRSRVPVVVGVGHETDVTLADFAADLRAPTPTAAAELVAATRESSLQLLQARAALMHRRTLDTIDRHAQRLDRAALRLARPGQGVRAQAERLQTLGHRLAAHAPRAMQAQHARVSRAQALLQHRAALHLAAHRQHIAALDARLRALDPKQVLARGYAWLADQSGRPLMSIEQLRPELDVTATLHDGTAEMRVTRSRPTRKLPTMD